jgi:hypothetical protein
MVRWYDYLLAFLVADVMQAFFFGVPILGGFVAYALYMVWVYVYCDYRKGMEYGNS